MIEPVLDFLGNPIRTVAEQFFRSTNEVFHHVNHLLDEVGDLFDCVLHTTGLFQALIKFRDLVGALGDKLNQIAGIGRNVAEGLFGNLPYAADHLTNDVQAVRHTGNDTANLVHLLFVFRESLHSVGQFAEAPGHVEKLLACLGREHFLEFGADGINNILDSIHDVPEALNQLVAAAKILPAFYDLVSCGSGLINNFPEEIAHAGQKRFCFLEITDDIFPCLRPAALRRFLKRIKKLRKGFHLGGGLSRVLCQLENLIGFF